MADIQAFIERLTDSNSEIRKDAAEQLAALGPDARAAVPALVHGLSDEFDEYVRWSMLEALADIGPAASEAIDAIVPLLGDEDLLEEAAAALARIGGNGVKKLGEALGDPDAEIRRAAARALAECGAGARAAMPALLGALQDRDDETRLAAAHTLGRTGRQIAAVGPALLTTLQDDHPSVRAAAAAGLDKLPELSDSGSVALAKLLRDDNPAPRLAAAHTLARRGNSEALEVLSRALGHQHPAVRFEAAMRMRELGPAAAGAVPALVQAMRETNPELLGEYISALGAIGPAASDLALEKTRGFLENGTPEVAAAAAEALGGFGEAARACAGTLAQALSSDDPSMFLGAAASLIRLGEHTDEAFDRIRACLSDPDEGLRGAALIALHELGELAEPTREAIMNSLADDSFSIREEALRTLIAVGGPPAQLIKAVQPLRYDSDRGVRHAAAAALDRVSTDLGK
ncbi:MAG: HEAT repeat domain-containing protein [Planctomycetota bacterium]